MFWNPYHGFDLSPHPHPSSLKSAPHSQSWVRSAVRARPGHKLLSWVTEPALDIGLSRGGPRLAGLDLEGGSHRHRANVGPSGRPGWTAGAEQGRREGRGEGRGEAESRDSACVLLDYVGCPNSRPTGAESAPFTLVNSSSAYSATWISITW